MGRSKHASWSGLAVFAVALQVLGGCGGGAADPRPASPVALERGAAPEAGGGEARRSAYQVPLRSLSALSVMSFNLRFGTSPDGDDHWDRRQSLVFEVIRAQQPDVLALQEDAVFQIEQILEAVPEYAAIGGGSDGGTGGEHVAILYRMDRLEPSERGVFWLSERPDEPGSRGFGSSYPRLCTWAVLRDRRNDLSFAVYNTHLDHRAGEARSQGLAMIATHIREHAGARPVLVTGDLNLGPEDPALTRFLTEARMIDTYRAAHPGATDAGTYHAFRGGAGGQRIDFVLASEGARVRSADIIQTRSAEGRYPSDHYPIITTILLEHRP